MGNDAINGTDPSGLDEFTLRWNLYNVSDSLSTRAEMLARRKEVVRYIDTVEALLSETNRRIRAVNPGGGIRKDEIRRRHLENVRPLLAYRELLESNLANALDQEHALVSRIRNDIHEVYRETTSSRVRARRGPESGVEPSRLEANVDWYLEAIVIEVAAAGAAALLGNTRHLGKLAHGAQVADNTAPLLDDVAGHVSKAVARSSRGVPATKQLADEFADVGLPRSKQTVVLIETSQGKTIVAAGGPDLSAAQKALARKKGLLIADDLSGFHAEITGVASAGKRGLLPTRGLTTTKMCKDGSNSCFEQLTHMARRGGYEVKLSSDGRSFEFIMLGGK